MEIRRRSFLELALMAVPATAAFAQNGGPLSRPRTGVVPAGEDREGKKHAVGVSSTTYKVSTAETGGSLFMLEQQNHKKGGPNRHLHHGEDEVFFVLEGEYDVEVGGELFTSRPETVCWDDAVYRTPGPLWAMVQGDCS